MGTLMRTVVSVVALILVFPIPGLGQNTEVVVIGHLQVYNTEGPICSQIRDAAVIYFTPGSGNLSFDGQTRSFDRHCKWMGTGTLFQGEARLTVNAQLKDFVQYLPNEPIPIRSTTPSSPSIREDGVRVILYDKERFSSEVRARANQSLKANDITQAIELYDVAFENLPDPETLFLKADALDQVGRHADAASTWHQAFKFVSDSEAVGWRRAADVSWRWTNSLYKAAEAETESKPETWLNVAEAAEKALDLQLPNLTNRSRIMAVWLDSLFKAANVPGDYSRLGVAIQSNQNLQKSWDALFYKRFRNESPPVNPSSEDILQGIGKLEAALGRPVR